MKKIFLASLLMSVWIVVLFWGKNIGLSMFLAIVPFVYLLIDLLEKKEIIKYRKSKVLIIPIILLSSTYFIFDNSFFNTLNFIVIPTLIVFMIIKFFENKLNIDKFFLRIIELVIDPLTYIETIFTKLKDCLFSILKFKRSGKKESSITKGLIITIPLVIIIIALLASADDVFGNIFVQGFNLIITALGDFELTNIILKLFVIVCLFIYFSCFFYCIAYEYKPEDEEFEKSEPLENTTVNMILVALNIVYVLFCFIQIKELFLGKADTANYSQYARKGFFQLMIVSFINLVVILFSKKSEKSKFINGMCLFMICCTFIILLSSAFRMSLYEGAYGYTRLRLLVYFALFTEAILLVPTIIYVLDKKINLQNVYFSIIIFMYVFINFANVDNIITKNNVDRYFDIGVFDVEYLKKETGTDAVKELIRIRDSEAQNEDEQEIKERVTLYLDDMHKELEKENVDFRDFNISKFIAKKLY